MSNFVGMTPTIQMAGNKPANGENASLFLGYLGIVLTEMLYQVDSGLSDPCPVEAYL